MKRNKGVDRSGLSHMALALAVTAVLGAPLLGCSVDALLGFINESTAVVHVSYLLNSEWMKRHSGVDCSPRTSSADEFRAHDAEWELAATATYEDTNSGRAYEIDVPASTVLLMCKGMNVSYFGDERRPLLMRFRVEAPTGGVEYHGAAVRMAFRQAPSYVWLSRF